MINNLIAKASDFTAFLLENRVALSKVIVFGSATSGEFDEQSDIDVFIESDKKLDGKIQGLKKIYEEGTGKQWDLKGVSNPISITSGNLASAENIRRSIQANGIILYSKYIETPQNAQAYVLFILNAQKLPRSSKVKLWRRLYGYSQRIGKKVYKNPGLLSEIGGKKLEKSTVLIPAKNTAVLRKFLNQRKVGFTLYEFWAEA